MSVSLAGSTTGRLAALAAKTLSLKRTQCCHGSTAQNVLMGQDRCTVCTLAEACFVFMRINIHFRHQVWMPTQGRSSAGWLAAASCTTASRTCAPAATRCGRLRPRWSQCWALAPSLVSTTCPALLATSSPSCMEMPSLWGLLVPPLALLVRSAFPTASFVFGTCCPGVVCRQPDNTASI